VTQPETKTTDRREADRRLYAELAGELYAELGCFDIDSSELARIAACLFRTARSHVAAASH
jgi:hypothetical protein